MVVTINGILEISKSISVHPLQPEGNAELERLNQPLGKVLSTVTVEGKVWQ